MNEDVTTLVFSFNEERRIGYFLKAVERFSPIVVIDNYSTDNTIEVAKKYSKRVYQYKNAGYAEHPDVAGYALSLVSSEWVYWGRVDEIPPLPLLEKLDQIVQSDACDVVLISRLNLLFGVPSKAWGDDYQLIFFKKSCIDVSKSALLESGSISRDARVVRLPATRGLSLWHFSSYDISAYLNASNRYGALAAKTIFDQRNDSSPNYSNSPEFSKRTIKNVVRRLQATPSLTGARLFLVPIMRFCWHFVIRGGIKSGWVGLITSYLMMIEQMITEMKIWELEKGIALEVINCHYDELKSRLVAGKVPSLEEEAFPLPSQLRITR